MTLTNTISQYRVAAILRQEDLLPASGTDDDKSRNPRRSALFFQPPSMMMNLDVGGTMEYTHRFLYPLSDVLLSRLVVRVDFGHLYSTHDVGIDILNHPEPAEDKNLVLIRYSGKLQNTEFKEQRSCSLSAHKFLPKDWALLDKVEETWQKSHGHHWISELEFCGSLKIGGAIYPLRASSPRVLQQLTRVQMALEERLRLEQSPSPDLIDTYSRLGHFIEQRNQRIWDPLFIEE